MDFEFPVTDAPDLLKETTSRCPICHAPCPGRVLAAGKGVYLERTCETHGKHIACVASDRRFYHLSVGDRACTPTESSGPSCCGKSSSEPEGAGKADPFASLSTCLALIEIVDSCNLACPTCFADSPLSRAVSCVSLDDFKRRVDGVIA